MEGEMRILADPELGDIESEIGNIKSKRHSDEDLRDLINTVRFAREVIRETLCSTGEYPYYDLRYIRKMAGESQGDENRHIVRECRDILKALGESQC